MSERVSDGVKFSAIVACSVMTVVVLMSGCATSSVPASATTAQKLKADLADIAQVENDVRTQCGAQFASWGATAAAIASASAGAVAAAGGNYLGAVEAAAALYPVVAADLKGAECVYGVIKADYEKMKPAK